MSLCVRGQIEVVNGDGPQRRIIGSSVYMCVCARTTNYLGTNKVENAETVHDAGLQALAEAYIIHLWQQPKTQVSVNRSFTPKLPQNKTPPITSPGLCIEMISSKSRSHKVDSRCGMLSN